MVQINLNGDIIPYSTGADYFIYSDWAIIVVDYPTEEDKSKAQRMYQITKELSASDYKAIKHADGVISDEDYEPIRLERIELRAEYNTLEASLNLPQVSQEQIEKAKQMYLQKEEEKKARWTRRQT